MQPADSRMENSRKPDAIGFDLFNTLLTIHPAALEEAQRRLIVALQNEKITVEADSFLPAYVEAARRFVRAAREDGRETHNRFWIAAALGTLGHSLPADDARIARAVESYFSVFYPHCRLLPGTREILGELRGQYRLGLLTNFTHGPAAWRILEDMGLPQFFQVILISGELGYRKPHPSVFARLVGQLGVSADRTLFVGDDPVADIRGALEAGLQPVLTTSVSDHDIPSADTPLSPTRIDCSPDVPRISSWPDLLALLKA